jgi:putative Holliday junction resolvase
LALDIGDKTIGIALSDDLGITAQGLSTLKREAIKKDTDAIIALVDGHKCSCIVVGLPLNLDGRDSVQTEKVRAFVVKLENKLRSTGRQHIKLYLHDERFTTKIAERLLIEADVSKKKRKEIIDMQAAVIILQSWLEINRSKIYGKTGFE